MQKVGSLITENAQWDGDMGAGELSMESIFSIKAKRKKEESGLAEMPLLTLPAQNIPTTQKLDKGIKGGVRTLNHEIGKVKTTEKPSLKSTLGVTHQSVKVIDFQTVPAQSKTMPLGHILPKESGITVKPQVGNGTEPEITTAIASEMKVTKSFAEIKPAEPVISNDRASFSQPVAVTVSTLPFNSIAGQQHAGAKQRPNIPAAHPQSLSVSAGSEPESGFRYQFSQWGHAKHVTVNTLPEQVLFQPSDGSVQQRIAGQWHNENRALHWQLTDEEQSEEQQRRKVQNVTEEDDV